MTQKISELISKYFLCWDERRFNLQSFQEIFSQDAQIKLPPTEIISGIKNIIDLHADLSQMFISTHHMTSDVLCKFLSDKEAECRCNFSAYHLYTKEKQKEYGSEFLIVRGVVNFSAVLLSDGWRISKLNVESVYRF